MHASPAGFGLSCALVTPFGPDGGINLPRFVEQARWCLAEGCDSVTVLGTTGEGASIGPSTRQPMLDALRDAGIEPGRQVIGGVAAASVEEALAQARQLLEAGVRALLVTPPFYFKNPGEDGLFGWFAALFSGLGGQARDVILYNIPSVTAVPLPPALVARLRQAFPGVIVGVKDSSGDWDSAKAYLAAHSDLTILIGDERHLGQAMAIGAAGAISGMANVMPRRLLAMIRDAEPDPLVSAAVDEVLRHPVTAAIKALIAARTGDAAWRRMRPPLTALSEADAGRLGAALRDVIETAPLRDSVPA